jgi:hypothetical protein
MRWAGRVARMGEKCVHGFGGKARRKDTTRKTKTWMGLEWILRLAVGGYGVWLWGVMECGCGGLWSGFRWPRIGTDSDSCEDGNMSSGSSARELQSPYHPAQASGCIRHFVMVTVFHFVFLWFLVEQTCFMN